MTELYNHGTKQWEDVPDSEITDRIKSGNYTFQAGVNVPAVSPNGDIGQVPSEDLYNAFQQGYRFPTADDNKAAENRAQEAIKQERFGNEAGKAAYFAGVSGLTLGGSDVAIRAIGGREAADAVRMAEEASPTATALGQLGGGIAHAAILGDPSALLKTGAEEAAAAAPGALSAAKSIVSSIGSEAAKGSIAGAYFGLGQGVSEAALGNPDNVVENLAAHAGLGFMYGGAFGAAFGGASGMAPLAKKIGAATTNKLDDIVQSTAQKYTTWRGLAAMTEEQKAELGDAYQSMMGDKDFRALVQDGQIDKAKKLADTYSGAAQDLIRNSNRMSSDLESAIRKYPRQVQDELKSQFQSAGGDMNQFISQTFDKYQEQAQRYDDFLSTLTGPAKVQDEFMPKFDSFIDAAQKSGDVDAIARADALDQFADARLRVPNLTEGEEVRAMTELRRKIDWYDINKGTNKLDRGQGRDALNGLYDTINDTLRGPSVSPTVAQTEAHLNPFYKSIMDVKSMAGAGDTFVSPRKLSKVMLDPTTRAQLDPLVSNLSEFAPELDAIYGKASTAQSKLQGLQDIKTKISNMTGGELHDAVTSGDIDHLLTEIGADRPIFDRLDQVREAQQQIAGLKGASPIDKAIITARALGQDTPELLQMVQPYQKEMGLVDALKAGGGSQDMAAGLLSKDLRRRGVQRGVEFALGRTGQALTGAYNLYRGMTDISPLRAMDMLTSVEKYSRSGTKAMQKWGGRISDALVSDTAKTVGKVASGRHKRSQ